MPRRTPSAPPVPAALTPSAGTGGGRGRHTALWAYATCARPHLAARGRAGGCRPARQTLRRDRRGAGDRAAGGRPGARRAGRDRPGDDPAHATRACLAVDRAAGQASGRVVLPGLDRGRDPRGTVGVCGTSSRGGSASPSATSSRTGAVPAPRSRSSRSTRRARSSIGRSANGVTASRSGSAGRSCSPRSATGTRLHLRLRISALGRRAPRLITTLAGLVDEATVAPLFAGLAERLRRSASERAVPVIEHRKPTHCRDQPGTRVPESRTRRVGTRDSPCGQRWRRATHSMWWVIGNTSKARRAASRVAAGREERDVPGEGGRVAGDVRDRARRRGLPARRPRRGRPRSAAGRATTTSGSAGSAAERRLHPPDPPPDLREVAQVAAGPSATRGLGRLDHGDRPSRRPARRARPRTARRRRRGPSRPARGAAAQLHHDLRPGRPAAPGAPARTRPAGSLHSPGPAAHAWSTTTGPPPVGPRRRDGRSRRRPGRDHLDGVAGRPARAGRASRRGSVPGGRQAAVDRHHLVRAVLAQAGPTRPRRPRTAPGSASRAARRAAPRPRPRARRARRAGAAARRAPAPSRTAGRPGRRAAGRSRRSRPAARTGTARDPVRRGLEHGDRVGPAERAAAVLGRPRRPPARRAARAGRTPPARRAGRRSARRARPRRRRARGRGRSSPAAALASPPVTASPRGCGPDGRRLVAARRTEPRRRLGAAGRPSAPRTRAATARWSPSPPARTAAGP